MIIGWQAGRQEDPVLEQSGSLGTTTRNRDSLTDHPSSQTSRNLLGLGKLHFARGYTFNEAY